MLYLQPNGKYFDSETLEYNIDKDEYIAKELEYKKTNLLKEFQFADLEGVESSNLLVYIGIKASSLDAFNENREKIKKRIMNEMGFTNEEVPVVITKAAFVDSLRIYIGKCPKFGMLIDENHDECKCGTKYVFDLSDLDGVDYTDEIIEL